MPDFHLVNIYFLLLCIELFYSFMYSKYHLIVLHKKEEIPAGKINNAETSSGENEGSLTKDKVKEV